MLSPTDDGSDAKTVILGDHSDAETVIMCFGDACRPSLLF
jgi:hypothetical protein